MAAERLRVFNGSTELSLEAGTITRSNDTIIDEAEISVLQDSSLGASSTLDFKKSDGSTTIFSVKIQNIDKGIPVWKIKGYAVAFELMNNYVEQVYESTSPEDIIKDVINNHTSSLTFASTATSGVTLDHYEADAYAVDVVRDMLEVLRWQIRIDYNGNVYVEPEGDINNGLVLENGVNGFLLTNYSDTDKTKLVNHVKIIGGSISKNYEETVSGTGTTFSLSHRPIGNVRVTVGGTLIEPSVENSPYTVDAENKQIVFTTSRTDPTFQYEYSQPVIVEDQEDSSIATHGEVFQRVPAPFLNTFPDARKYARQYLDRFSEPLVKAVGYQPGLNFDVSIGETVHLKDTIRTDNIDKDLVINRIVLDIENNKTVYYMGSPEYLFHDWQRDIQDRIKKLERQITNEDDKAYSRLFKHKARVKLTLSTTVGYASPQNSFITGHDTLGFNRESFDFEPDCSLNGNSGTWNGTGIGGSQYSLTSGVRLSYATFNGTDNYVEASDSTSLALGSGDFSVFFWLKTTYSGSNQLTVINKLSGTTGFEAGLDSSQELFITLKDGTNTVTATSTYSGSLNDGSWHHIGIKVDRTAYQVTFYIDNSAQNTVSISSLTGSITNTENLYVGSTGGSSNFYDGSLDEIIILGAAATTSVINEVYNKFFGSDQTSFNDCKLWYAFDNPVNGDNFGSITYVTVT